jgi:GAG-pre-integrase domain
MHVPDAGACYFSVSALMQKGGQISFKDKNFIISLQGQTIAQGYQEGNLFWLDTSDTALHAISNAPTSIDLWHACMGHMSYPALKHYKDSIKGITLDSSIDQINSPCSGYELGKQAQSPFLGSSK